MVVAQGNAQRPPAPRSPLAPVSELPAAPEPRGWRARRARRGADLAPDPLPIISPESWGDTEDVLARLYRRVERNTMDILGRYARRTRRQRRIARLLRAVALLLAAAGGLLPLIALARSDSGNIGWGYVFLAAAGLVLAIDRVFGVTTAWRRGVLGAQRIRARLEIFQDDWTAVCAPGAPDGSVDDRLALLRGFTTDIRALVARDTIGQDSEL
jgi:hypothetical protein